MNPRIGASLCVALLFSLAAAQPTPEDRRFFLAAYRGNMAEVALGSLALRLGSSPAVRGFARQSVSDHGKAEIELSRVARLKGMPSPQRLDRDAQRTYRRLARLKGPEFDRAYRDATVQAHKAEVVAYEEASKRGSDEDIRHYAAKTLATVRAHLAAIQAVKA